MGAIQSSINSLIGTAGAAAAVKKGLDAAAVNVQEKAMKKAMQTKEFEVNMKLKQQQIKTARAAMRYANAKTKQVKGEMSK